MPCVVSVSQFRAQGVSLGRGGRRLCRRTSLFSPMPLQPQYTPAHLALNTVGIIYCWQPSTLQWVSHPRQNHSRDITHHERQVLLIIQSGLSVRTVRHTTNFEIRHIAELTCPRSASAFPRHRQRPRLQMEGFSSFRFHDIFISARHTTKMNLERAAGRQGLMTMLQNCLGTTKTRQHGLAKLVANIMFHCLCGNHHITNGDALHQCSGGSCAYDPIPMCQVDQVLCLNSKLCFPKPATCHCDTQSWEVCDRELSSERGIGLIALLKAGLQKVMEFILRRNNGEYLHGTRLNMTTDAENRCTALYQFHNSACKGFRWGDSQPDTRGETFACR